MAVDIGGTFTDIVLDRGAERITRKVLTTPRPEEGVLVRRAAGARRCRPAFLRHRRIHPRHDARHQRDHRAARRAHRADRHGGFRDTLDIATESRYDQYDLTIEKPQPLVPRSLRFTVPERVDVHGKVRLRSDEAAVERQGRAASKTTASRRSRSVSCIRYVNPAHEQRAGRILKKRCRS
jgi:N-methylhydantoinase A